MGKCELCGKARSLFFLSNFSFLMRYAANLTIISLEGFC
jgi:hypothetical protein